MITKVPRPDLVAGPHPEDPETWLIFRPDTGDAYEVSALAWQIVEALDGGTTSGAVAHEVGATAHQVELVVERLDGLGLLCEDPQPRLSTAVPSPQWARGPVPETFELVIHPQARFSCVGVGTCCERGYVIPVRTEQTEVMRRAARALGIERDPVTVWPGGPGQPWSYVLDNDEGCPFYSDDRRCGIHATEAHPDACNVFPLVFAQVGSQVVVSASYRCACGTGGQGERLTDQEDEVRARLAATPHLPIVPEFVALDDEVEVPGADAAETMMQVALRDWDLGRPGAGSRMIAATIGGLAELGEVELGEEAQGSSLSVLRGELAALTEAEDLKSALQGEPAVDVAGMSERLREGGAIATGLGHAEVARYVRDHLFGLRPFQQASLTQGLLALAICVHASAGEGLVEARAQVMAWDDVIPQEDLRIILAEADAPAARRLAALAARLSES